MFVMMFYLFRLFELACGDYCTLAGVEANRDSVVSVEDNGGCRLGSGYRIIDVAALELDIIICLARDDLGADIGYLAVDGLHLCLGIALRVGVIRRIDDLVRIDIDIDAVRLELVNILCKALGKGLAVDLYLRVLLDVDKRVALNDLRAVVSDVLESHEVGRLAINVEQRGNVAV